ncbi:DNA internalization-related competence protein ComEC/Rec2 [Paenibacillus sp. LMG 31456]|uniref:DNA internalization-related competence protein ComEC/Rec2 n=1 Tax=Paenibacillus foliorum TaxID=2654974 RepID=A0A972GSF8_9BACL|nr:DNA internalization-related competence protein ComEC/Rec2 [Paenibacillus foliorum]NOU95503.1 DNA internalization-related competence protein ComEC/Rec2 [Paenibacillus foliorum]
MSRRPVVAAALLWTAGYVLAFSVQWDWLSVYISLFLGIAAIGLWFTRVPGRTAMCCLLIIMISAGYYEDYDRHNQTKLSISVEAAEKQKEIPYGLDGLITTRVDVDGDKASFTVRSDRDEGELFAVSIKLLSKEEQYTAQTWQRGDHVGLTGTLQLPGEARNFDGFDYRSFLRFKHVHWQLTVKGANQVKIVPSNSWTWDIVMRWNDQFREMLGEGIGRIFPAEQTGFMKSMLIGVTDDMDPLQFQQFSQLGLTHILAVSGLNVAIFLTCLLWLMRRLRFTRETYLLTAITLMPFYIAVTGASPSIIRAGLMAMLALYAAYRHTLKDGLHTVLLVGLGMLIWEPYFMLDVSFQLSFLVTIGLIIGVPPVNSLLPIRSTVWRNAVSITLVAQCVSFPVSIYYFNQFSLLSFLANFFLVPIFSMVTMPGGTAALILGFAYVPAGKAVAWIIAQINGWIFDLVDMSSRWDWFQTIWPTPGIGWIVCYYASCTAFVWFLLQKKRKKNEHQGPMLSLNLTRKSIQALRIQNAASIVGLPICILSLLLLLGLGYKPELWKREGQVDFIDVGQGDSIIITTPQNRRVILVDGGGTISFRKPGDEWKQRKDSYEVGRKLLVPLLKKRGIQRIDYLIVTHQDADHIGGLQAVLEQIPVSKLIFNGTFKPGIGVEKLFQTALDKQVKLVKAFAGDRLQADSETVLSMLAPVPWDAAGGLRLEKEQNEESVVFMMEMSGTRWLFTGDMDQASETAVLRMLEADWNLIIPPVPSAASANINFAAPNVQRKITMTTIATNIDVLKVAHHGSKTSSSTAWLDSWKPRLAVISVGLLNSYGHPNPQVLSRLEERDVSILRTDRNGEVQMRVKDGKIQVRTKLIRNEDHALN